MNFNKNTVELIIVFFNFIKNFMGVLTACVSVYQMCVVLTEAKRVWSIPWDLDP